MLFLFSVLNWIRSLGGIMVDEWGRGGGRTERSDHTGAASGEISIGDTDLRRVIQRDIHL